MTNQVLIVAANTLNIKEQKTDKGSRGSGVACFEEILRAEGSEEEKESKNADVSCFLNLMSCFNGTAAESSAYEAGTNNYSDKSLLRVKGFCDAATTQTEDTGIKMQVDKAENFNKNSADGQTEIPDKIEDSANDVLFHVSKYKDPAVIQEQNTDNSIKVDKTDRHYKNENITPAHVQEQNGNESVKAEGRIIQNIKNNASVLGQKINIDKSIKIGVRAAPENESSQTGAKAENDLPEEGNHVARNPEGSVPDSLKVQKKWYHNNSEEKQKTSEDTFLNEVTTLKSNDVPEFLHLKSDPQNKIDTFENLKHLIEKVESKIAKALPGDDGFQEFDIHIKPEFLGKLEIRLIKNQGGMNVKIITSNQEVRQMLTANAELMQNQLNKRGIELRNVEIIYNVPLGDGNMRGNESYQQPGRGKASKSRMAYVNTDRGDPKGNSIQTDININGTVSYLV